MNSFCAGLLSIVALLFAVGCNQQDQMSAPERPVPDAEIESTNDMVVADAAASPSADQGASGSAREVAIATSVTKQRQLVSRRILDPQNDQWTTEVIASKVLDVLHKVVAPDLRNRALEQAKYVAKNVLVSDLQPKAMKLVYEGPMIRVHQSTNSAMTTIEGSEILQTVIASPLLSASDKTIGLTEFESHFKVVDVQQDGNSIRTKIIVELYFPRTENARQVNATWHCTWRKGDLGNLLMTELNVSDYEETVMYHPQHTWFVDRSDEVLGTDATLQRQISRGHHHWLQRIERVQRFDTSVRNGLAVGDVNGDGLDDLYLCQPPGLPNRLFMHQADGTTVEQSAAFGVDWMDQTSAAVFCDFDNDGDQDLVLGMHVGLLIMENDGNTFQVVNQLQLDYDVQSLSVVDYDNDGWLDIFACVYRTKRKAPGTFLYRDAVGGGANRLFRNQKTAEEWTFMDVTDSVGLDVGADRFSLAASWEDFDNDGDQDLYVANDFGRNHLYKNQNGQFKDVAESADVLDVGSGMSVSWADFNRDGLMDLYVGNMFSSAGQRVTSQAKFRPQESDEIREIYRRLAKGNSLFANQGDGRFTETQANVELGRWAWSSIFADINNDGWEDLLVANGYMTTPDSGDL